MWGRSAYGTQYDVSSPAGALRALPVGVLYLLFAPFPWAISGIRQLLTVPETLVWYALMPAFVRGVAYSVRHRLRDVLPILVFAVTLTIAYALMQGNVGTAYRQRTQVTMFFFVFMALGLVLRGRQSISQPFDPVLATTALATSVHAERSSLVDHDFVYDEAAESEGEAVHGTQAEARLTVPKVRQHKDQPKLVRGGRNS
jgi:hypothetical protein